MCRNTTTCAKDELCTHGYTNILGRRLIAGVHQECESCCSGTALCNHDLHCDPNTQKTYNTTCTFREECQRTMYCTHGICKCDHEDYWSGSVCLAKKPLNSTCSKNGDCKIAFRCINNKCKCLPTEVWDGSQCTRRNDNIHLISTYGHHELSIYMERPNTEHKWGNYSTFNLADEMAKYILTVTRYTGNTGFDALDASSAGNANGQAFSTKDRDNDRSSGTCAVDERSGWWFNSCEYSNLNKPYTGYMYWANWASDISKSLIMIRRT
ncbi:unnamed protein product [Mytilus coruscus]|uniref:Fibrinogen C-terminal domain-containing protein n=1 Tax=Mytilus coruscus TaxID=42192 RepID=A0A6J8EWZ0_MYTCO|nr:unnamed protein product [Mytilus coruscus]